MVWHTTAMRIMTCVICCLSGSTHLRNMFVFPASSSLLRIPLQSSPHSDDETSGVRRRDDEASVDRRLSAAAPSKCQVDNQLGVWC